MIIRIDYPESDVRLDLWGGTSGTFAGLDRFNRIIDQRWQNAVSTTPVDIDRYQYGYDRDFNRTWKQNTVGSNFDEFYTYDDLNRLTSMQRGTLTGTPPTGISGTPVKEQDWTLDPLGNWNGFLTKTSGTTDLNQSRTHDVDNQITAIGGTPAWATPPAYDAAGNMKSFPQPSSPTNAFGAVYDAWNRLKTITDGSNTVAEYDYDGDNQRIVKKTYTSGTLTETRHAYYTPGWQDIEERVGTSTSADLQYVWGMRYVDELVCRDDAIPQRLYACQDANFNLTSITDDSGAVQERYVFEPYGTRAIYNASWILQSSSSFAWVVGHQGLIEDVETGLIYNRNRMLDSALGRFLQRDPLEYVDGNNLYEYLLSNSTTQTDCFGTKSASTKPCCCCCVDDLAISGVARYARGGREGHDFDVNISLSYKASKSPSDCELEWWEWTTIADLPGQKIKTWQEWQEPSPTHPVFNQFNRWTRRSKPCPGSEKVPVHDPPGLVLNKMANRKRLLKIHVIARSGKDCDCANTSKEGTILQYLEIDNGKMNWNKSWIRTYTETVRGEPLPIA